MTTLFKSFLTKTGYVLAVLFILIAVILIGGEFLSPVLNQKRAAFENYASSLVKAPVKIENIDFSWNFFRPEISFNNVTVLNKQTNQPALQIKRVSVLLSIPESIWQRKAVPSGITIADTSITINEINPGQYSIPGLEGLTDLATIPTSNKEKFFSVIGFLMQPPYLRLHNIDVHYSNLAGVVPREGAVSNKRFITVNDLEIANSENKHKLKGKAFLHQTVPTQLTFLIRWRGNTPDLNQIKAKGYVYVSGLALSQWIKGYSWQGFQANDGIMSAKIWINWRKGALQKLQTSFNGYDINLFSEADKSNHKLNRISGSVGWKREGNTQIIAGEDLLIDLPTHLWPVTNFYISLESTSNGTLTPRIANIGYVDLQDVQNFLFSAPAWFPEKIRTYLTQLQPKGSLENIEIKFPNALSDWQQTTLNADFNQLSISPWLNYPAFNNFTGSVQWDGREGKLALDSKQSQFQYNALFTNPIDLSKVSGDLEFELDQTNAWHINIPSLQLTNKDASATVSGKITLGKNAYPVTDLSAKFNLQKAQHVTRYLPLRIFSKELTAWLSQAFLAGNVKSGHALLRGSLGDFPFDKKNGTFLITGLVNQVDFQYAANWPRLKNVTGKLTFSGNKMIADVDHADILDIPIGKVRGEIPSLNDANQTLLVQGEPIEADIAQGLNFLHASPLEKTIGKMFSNINMQGPMALTLGLNLPLANPTKTKVTGDLSIKDVTLLTTMGLKLNDLNGQIRFTENNVVSQNIQGTLFEKPISLNLKTIEQKSKKSIVQANFVAENVNVLDLQKWLDIPLTQVVEGATKITGAINFSENEPIFADLQSNLVGMTVKLPNQYAKKPAEARNFGLNLIYQEAQGLQLKLNYANLISSALIFERDKEKINLTGLNLHLGTGEASWPEEPGLSISGNFDKLDWDEIKKYIEQASGHLPKSTLKLRKIDVNAKEVAVFGQELSQVHIQVEPKEAYWQVNLNSNEAVGQLEIPTDFTPQNTMSAHFSKLNLYSTKAKEATPKLTINKLPALSFTADSVIYNDMELGRISFRSEPSLHGMIIQRLEIAANGSVLNGVGSWEQENNEYTTYLRGNIKTNNVTELLSGLGFDTHNFIVDNGTLMFDLNWRGAPYQPLLASLNGNANLTVGHGRILNVGQGSGTKMDIGRMLSIFSLETLRNINQVFESGYSFDSLKGDMTFEHGDAFTRNLEFNGGIARVSINGRIGLKNQDYHLLLSVTPYITSSIPVAATLLTGQPLIGLAAFAVNTMIVPKVTTYYYLITGSWNNPIWTSVSGS